MNTLGAWAPRSPAANPKRQRDEEEKERAAALRQWLHQREAGEALPPPLVAHRQAAVTVEYSRACLPSVEALVWTHC